MECWLSLKVQEKCPREQWAMLTWMMGKNCPGQQEGAGAPDDGKGLCWAGAPCLGGVGMVPGTGLTMASVQSRWWGWEGGDRT